MSKEDKQFRVTRFLQTDPFGPGSPNALQFHRPLYSSSQGETMSGHPVHHDKCWQGMLDAKPHRKKTQGARTVPPAEAALALSIHPRFLPAQCAPKPSSLRHEAKIQREISTLNLLITPSARTETLVLSGYPLIPHARPQATLSKKASMDSCIMGHVFFLQKP